MPHRDDSPAGGRGPFRFTRDLARYRRSSGGRPLFRRWEAVGLLLLITVGAAFVPGVRGAPAIGTLLMEAAARGDLRARFFSLAPPLLALLFAWRAGGRLVRPFNSYSSVAVNATLSAVLVYLAFHLGLHLALRVGGEWPWWSPWLATLPGAALGWALMLLVAAIRLLWGRAADDLAAARHALDETGPGAGDDRNND